MIEFLKQGLSEFGKNWWRYSVLFFTTNFILLNVIIPILSFSSRLILTGAGIPYISYNNFLDTLLHHPFTFLLLILLLLIIIIVIFIQFVFLSISTKLISQGQAELGVMVKETFRRIVLLKKGKAVSFFLFYFILIIPFSSYTFNTPLLNKVKIPQFILDFLLTNVWVDILLILAVFFIFVISLRYLMILPLMSLQLISIDEAFAINRELFKGRFIRQIWHFTKRFLGIFLITFIPTQFIYYILYFFQIFIDNTAKNVALPIGIGSLAIINLLGYIVSAISSMLFFYLLTKDFSFKKMTDLKTKKFPKARKILGRSIVVLGTLIMLAVLILISFVYMKGALTESPILISHRGVNHQNGVQNTIPALIKTNKDKPDYVEMDIMETKDKQFVVMHDANLKALTGHNIAPQDLTLAEITKLKASENGMTASIPSFDDYYAEAEKLHQKLLIEIKTSKKDTQDMLDIFVQKYGKRILADGNWIHSLDYHVVTTLKEKAPELFVSFILPYNLIFPQTGANAYTMEESTLNSDFIFTAHAVGKEVFAWTANDSATIERMNFIGVDGIITDNLTFAKEEIEDYENNPNYAERLLRYFDMIPSPGKMFEN